MSHTDPGQRAPDNGSGQIPFVDEGRLTRLLSMDAAIDALEAAAARPVHENPLRQHYNLLQGELLVMPAWGPEGAGVKLVSVRSDNPERDLPFVQGLFVLFSPDDGRPIATIDGAALTALRTAAVSGLATKMLARQDASRLMLIGAGRQAHAHLEAMAAVRPLETVKVVNRGDRARAAALVSKAREMGLAAEVADLSSLGDVDLVCACTSSRSPVLDGSKLAPGTHVVGMGAYRPDMCELDAETLARGSVFVEDLEAAKREAGDLIQAAAAGTWSWDRLAGLLTDVARGTAGRESDDQITVFKSVGMAWEDLVVACASVAAIEDRAAA